MMNPLYEYERALHASGVSLVCGVDEAGRGPLAGPVYAAAVILPKDTEIEGLADSKKLSSKKREALYQVIVSQTIAYGIASASVEEITETDILSASQLAMVRAVALLSTTPELALIDGNIARGFPTPTQCVIKGDQLVACIAAASILAKVSRDTYMQALDVQFPQYGFAKHKGYATTHHYAALAAHGACIHHRPLFLRTLPDRILQGTKK